MKELILRATLSAVHCSITLPWICTQLSLLVRKPETAPAVPPRCLLSRPQETELEVWLKDAADSCPDPRFCRYRRLALRPLDVSPSALADAPAELKIAVGLLPPAWLYVDAPLDGLLQQGLQPRQVMADGRVVTMAELTPAQMRHMEHLYAVADEELVARLQGSLQLPAPPGVRPNRYAELEREVNLLLCECFREEGEAEGCPLRLHLSLCDVEPDRQHSIAPEYRPLLFGEGCTDEDPRCAFPAHDAYAPAAQRTLRLVMVYPQGGVETARRLCRLLQSLAGIIAVYPMGNEEGWIEYKMSDRVVDDVKQALLMLKQRNFDRPDMLVCYISPSGEDAVTAGRLHLRTHISLCCRELNILCMDSVPRQAVESGKLDKHADSLASQLVVKLKGLSWVPQRMMTQDTDLIICLSSRTLRRPQFCGATFCFNQEASLLHDFACEERHFLSFLYSDFKQSYSDFMAEHGGRHPQRLVVYCYRDVDVRHVEEFARLLGRLVPRLPVVAAFLRLTGAGSPAFYDPSTPCRMPLDGTYISCPDDTFLLFCNDFHPRGIRPPERFPHPLEVRLKHLDADGSFAPVTHQEAEELMTQVYQLTCLNPEKVERCVVPVIALHTDRIMRRTQDELLALNIDSAATSMDSGEVAEWRSGASNVLM